MNLDREALEREKNELIEELGILMERNHQLAPLAAKIMATLILTGKKGVTFDALVKGLAASKSTISCHLEQLQSTRKIQFYRKSGDRKRHFIISPDLTSEVIEETVRAWEDEKKVHQKILEFKRASNNLKEQEGDPLFDLSFQENILIFLEEATTAINKLKQQIVPKER